MYRINVYRIWWEGKDDLYVGSTKQKLSTRMVKHRGDCMCKKNRLLYTAMRVNGLDFSYVLLESYIVSCRDDQMKWEQKWIDKIQPNLNKIRAYNTSEDTKRMWKNYYENNKEGVLKKHKIYRDEHKSEAKVYHKQYKKEHKNELNVKNTEYRKKNRAEINRKRREVEQVECECGITMNKYSLPQHRKSKTHKKKINMFFLNLLPFQ